MPLALATLLALPCASICAQEADFYVAPKGNDRWSGKLAEPNAADTDGPFASVARSQQAVRELLRAGHTEPITVLLRGGTYFLAEPLAFTPDDSSAQAPVTYAAYPGETPLLSGGRPIGEWDVADDGSWRTHLADVEGGQWTFSQLFVNGGRRFRPRLPKQGYYYIAGEVSPSADAGGRGHDRFRFTPGDVRGDWSNIEDIEVLPFHVWDMSRMKIAEVDDVRSMVTFTGPTCAAEWWASLPVGNRYLIENVPDALSEPGEWYLDRVTGILTYLPLAGERPDAATVIAPRLPFLVQIAGDAEMGLWVEGLAFRGLTFAHTNWMVPPGGYSFPQAEASLGGAIRAVGARNCAFEQCAVTQVGEYALEFGDGCRDCRVESCALTDLGAGGVKIGSQGYAQDEQRICGSVTVSDCLIAHGGRMHPAGIGVLVMHSPDNVVSHNEIHDFYYTGISVGWQWAYAPSHARHNLIDSNLVYDIGQGVLSDMGGIYTLGPSEGTVIRGNVFHDIESYAYGGRGIYFDQATTGILAENNLVYRARIGAFCMHFGKDNRVVNNIFALGREGLIEPVRVEEHNQFDFERNLVYWREGPLMTSAVGTCYRMRSNLYWKVGGL